MKQCSSVKKGFSLVEILVVATIIGLLAAVGTVTYTQFLKSSRDATRKSDIAKIQEALEQYKSEKSTYPSGTDATGLGKLVTDLLIDRVPKDPKTQASYSYAPSPTGCDESLSNRCTSYQLSALSMEAQVAFAVNPYGMVALAPTATIAPPPTLPPPTAPPPTPTRTPTPQPPTPTPVTQCGDGTDNDADSWTDYPNDPGCSSASDSNESNTLVVQRFEGESFTGNSSTSVAGDGAASGGAARLYDHESNPGLSPSATYTYVGRIARIRLNMRCYPGYDPSAAWYVRVDGSQVVGSIVEPNCSPSYTMREFDISNYIQGSHTIQVTGGALFAYFDYMEIIY